MTGTQPWEVRSADRIYSGSAPSAAEAWTRAAAAALQLARHTDGAAALRIHVHDGGEPAEVLPSLTELGGLDLDATAAMLDRFLETVLHDTPPTPPGDQEQERPR